MRGSISACVSGQDGTGWRVMVASPSVAPQADACRAARHATRRAGPRGPDPSSVGHEPERAKGKESEAGEAAGELPEVATHGILPIHSWIERSASCRPPARLRHAIPLGRSEDVPAASGRAFAAASPMSISAVCNTADDPHCASTRKSSGNCVFIASRQWFPACLESGDEYPHCRGSTHTAQLSGRGAEAGALADSQRHPESHCEGARLPGAGLQTSRLPHHQQASQPSPLRVGVRSDSSDSESLALDSKQPRRAGSLSD